MGSGLLKNQRMLVCQFWHQQSYWMVLLKDRNLPHLQDITTMLELLNSMGSHINFDENGYIEINSSNIDLPEARYELVKTMRASILVMGHCCEIWKSKDFSTWWL